MKLLTTKELGFCWFVGLFVQTNPRLDHDELIDFAEAKVPMSQGGRGNRGISAGSRSESFGNEIKSSARIKSGSEAADKTVRSTRAVGAGS